MLPAQTPEESMEIGKRTPSSLEDALLFLGGSLLCPVDDAYWVFCLYPVVGEHLQHLDSCYDAKHAIVSSASGLGVKVRVGNDGWGVVAEAWSHGEDIAHGIDGSMAAQCLGCLDEPVSSLLAGVGEGHAAHACFGGCALRSSMLAMSFFSGIYSRTLRLFRYIIRSREGWASLYKETEVILYLPISPVPHWHV